MSLFNPSALLIYPSATSPSQLLIPPHFSISASTSTTLLSLNLNHLHYILQPHLQLLLLSTISTYLHYQLFGNSNMRLHNLTRTQLQPSASTTNNTTFILSGPLLQLNIHNLTSLQYSLVPCNLISSSVTLCSFSASQDHWDQHQPFRTITQQHYLRYNSES